MIQTSPIPFKSPESQGVSSKTILALIDNLEENIHEMHSIMLLRHGSVIADGWWSPYAPTTTHMLFSLTKSFTSTAVGLAVSEGRLSVEDTVLSFFPEEAPMNPGNKLEAMRVHHLLSMSTGHAVDTTPALVTSTDGNWVKAFFEQPVEFEPGTHFLYNSGASYILSAIVQKLTRLKLQDYLRPRLFAPLGINEYDWECSPQDINIGGWGLSITTEAIARFGQLYLQKGVWGGLQLVPSNWVETATLGHVSNGSNPESDWEQGYGYHFWRSRHGAYRGDGAFGQFCVVMPKQDAVLAITGGMDDMQPVLNLVWEYLLPGFEPTSLPEDDQTQSHLSTRLTNLKLPMPEGSRSSGITEEISGNIYTLEANDQKFRSVCFDFSEEGCFAQFQDERGDHIVQCGYVKWLQGNTTLIERQLNLVGCVTWQSEDTLVMTLRFYETPFCYTLTCCFTDLSITIHVAANVWFGPKEFQLIGTRIYN